jgi:NADPH-dependent 2,4-dienoyl-CoA reductase/sulfur reductase-like enzyme
MGLNRIVIVGGGVAAVRCAFELRRQGYDGHLHLLSAESTPPYDRTLASKALISGQPVLPEQLFLQKPGAYRDADVDLHLQARVSSLDVSEDRLQLADGSRVNYDRLVLAVGGEAVRPARLFAPGVVALRSIDDANKLSSMLGRAERVVIVGGGFIGTEVASTVVARGLAATIVEADRPFAALLGTAVADRICAMHKDHGVSLITGSPVDSVRRDGAGFRVDMGDGRRLAADVVVVAVGMRPATGWLTTCALRAPNGVPCDIDGRTVVPNIFAAGDCALAWDEAVGGYVTAEHWDVASRHGIRVARAILGLPAPAPRAPYFWSDQLGFKLQLVGRTSPADAVEFEESAQSPCFTARYLRAGRLIGQFAVGAPLSIAQARRELESPHEFAPQDRVLPDRSRPLPRSPSAPGLSPRASVYHSFSYPKTVEVARHGTLGPRLADGSRCPIHTTPSLGEL